MIRKEDVMFEPAGETRRLHIYLPDDYDYSDERYPVMYFFDGHNLFFNEDATYGTSWGLKEFLDHWGKKMIIVGLECAHGEWERVKEYSPYYFRVSRGKGINGTGEATMDWIEKTLKPMIDKRFRTWSHREATGIAGSSMGGLMALYGVTRYNHVFSKGACLSSAVSNCFSSVRKELREANLHPDTKVYLSYGEKEAGVRTAENHRILIELLQQKNAQVWFYLQSDGAHCEADWAKQVDPFMHHLWYE